MVLATIDLAPYLLPFFKLVLLSKLFLRHPLDCLWGWRPINETAMQHDPVVLQQLTVEEEVMIS